MCGLVRAQLVFFADDLLKQSARVIAHNDDAVPRKLFLFDGDFGRLNYRKYVIALFEIHSLD